MTVTINGTTGIAGTNGSAGTPAVQGEDTNTGLFFPAADTVGVATGGAERVRVNSSGNVLIGTSTSVSNNRLVISQASGDGANSGFFLQRNGAVGTSFKIDIDSSDVANFRRGGINVRSIDTSGNVLVGKTSAATGTVGVELRANGKIVGTMDGGNHTLNRLTSDGAIVELQKNTTTVGSIGTNGGNIYLVRGTISGVAIAGGGQWVATDSSGASADNTRDIGALTIRWNDVYATNGTIQTSDRNEKQQIAELTPAEMQAAKAISGLFKTFKWNDSVAEKGDAARIHSGVIAQEVEAAMTDAGLDAGKYAFFISSTWWETDGQTYETAEEAPEGAVERTRRGIRYPELLAFVGAATEQRLASIEARLTELEAK